MSKVSDNLTITADKQIQMVTVLNNIGQSVLTMNPDSKVVSLDVSKLTNGVYFIRTTSEEGQTTSKLILD